MIAMNRPFIGGSAIREITVAIPQRMEINCQFGISVCQKKKCQTNTVTCAAIVIAAQAGARSARTCPHA